MQAVYVLSASIMFIPRCWQFVHKIDEVCSGVLHVGAKKFLCVHMTGNAVWA